jgi:hypothetical protein
LAEHKEVEVLLDQHFQNRDLEGLKWIREKQLTLAKSMKANPWLVRLNWTTNGRAPKALAHLRRVALPRQHEQ